jgi:hypothetical protein
VRGDGKGGDGQGDYDSTAPELLDSTSIRLLSGKSNRALFFLFINSETRVSIP